jgi:HipA-like protein
MLQIFVNGRAVGLLKRSGVNSHLFEYSDGVSDDDCVSLLMLPSTAKSWPSKNLHPSFATSLPEGGVRKILTKKLSKSGRSYIQDMDLLAVVGRHLASPRKSANTSLQPHPVSRWRGLKLYVKFQMINEFFVVSFKEL